jgi:hypothetical protein
MGWLEGCPVVPPMGCVIAEIFGIQEGGTFEQSPLKMVEYPRVGGMMVLFALQPRRLTLMPLNFTGQEPFVRDNCVYLYGMDGPKAVLCQIYTETLMHMHEGEADPLQAFAMYRTKIETIFSSLYDLGLLDEKGEVTFSTEPHTCPAP